MSDADRRAEVLLLARKLRTAKTGSTEGLLSAEDMHLAVVALNHFEESAEWEYAVQTTDHTGKAFHPGELGWVSTIEGAEDILTSRLERWKERKVDWTAKIVKRRKAGAVEED